MKLQINPYSSHWLLDRVRRVHQSLCGMRGHSLQIPASSAFEAGTFVCTECGRQSFLDGDVRLKGNIDWAAMQSPQAPGLDDGAKVTVERLGVTMWRATVIDTSRRGIFEAAQEMQAIIQAREPGCWTYNYDPESKTLTSGQCPATPWMYPGYRFTLNADGSCSQLMADGLPYSAFHVQSTEPTPQAPSGAQGGQQ